MRDPAEAVRLAEGAVRAAGAPEPALLDTLVAAQATAGQLARAVETETRAAALARERGDAALRGEIERNLARYRSQSRAAQR